MLEYSVGDLYLGLWVAFCELVTGKQEQQIL